MCNFVIIISADAEWKVVKEHYPRRKIYTSPYGEWFEYKHPTHIGLDQSVVFIHGGWGKVSAAGSAQYAITRWHPSMLVNIGTCGGFEGKINRGDIILVEKTIIYDIFEQMGDPDEHILHYTVSIDNSWLEDLLPLQVTRTVLVSGDRDLFWKDISMLYAKYGAIAGDWESGAIAWVASKNGTQCLILRGVTDLVGEQGGEAYEGNVSYYYQNTKILITKLLETLPQWLVKFCEYLSDKESE
jgi:adenosylhomocysteine nucleosidase